MVKLSIPVSQQSREIRVFISSTFQDMNAERNELVSRVFPVLRRMAEERNVTLTEIDLRWGITKEESEDSKVVSICLDEIERSRPFFIGILGGRYGWKPAESAVNWHSLLEERYHSVADDIDRGLSMTEVEMQHGVFQSEEKPYAIFFVKNMPESVVDPDQRLLRQKVLEQTEFPVYKYDDAEKMGELVVTEFESLLDELYPKELADSWNALQDQQTDILHHRIQSYITRDDIEEKIMSFLKSSDNGYLLVRGESGMGKSTILASVVTRLQQSEDMDVLSFFPTFTTTSTSFMDVAQWFCKGFQHLYGIEYDDETSPILQLRAIASGLEPERPLCLVVDGINQLLDDAGSTADLSWWPAWGENVKCIFSTVNDAPVLKSMRDVKFMTLDVKRMLIDERMTLADKYFARFRKKLSKDQRDLLASDNAIYDNTMVFVSLLEQIRRYDSFEHLTDLMQHMSRIRSPKEFFMEVLRRQNTLEDGNLEAKFKKAMMLLLVSERGLPENLLMEILQMTRLELSKFISLHGSYLMTKSGRLVFGHDIYKNAIKELYGTDESAVREIRMLMVGYLERIEESIRLTELPYQYSRLQDFDELYRLVSDMTVFTAYASQQRIHIIARYWQQLLTTNQYRYDIFGILNSTPILGENAISTGMQHYLDVLTISNYLEQLVNMVSVYLMMPNVSLRLQHAQQKLLENEHEFGHLLGSLNIANANANAIKGEYREALSLYYNEIDDNTSMADAVIQNIGECFLKMFERYREEKFLDIACDILKSSLNTRLKDTPKRSNKELASAYANYGSAIFYKDAEKSIEYQKKALAYYEKEGGHYCADVAIQYHNMAMQHLLTKDYERALQNAEESLTIYQHLFGEENQNTMEAHQTIGYICKGMGDTERSINELQAALQYTIQKPHLRDTRKTLLEQLFSLHYQAKNYEEALETMNSYLPMLKEEDPVQIEEVIRCTGNVGKILSLMGRIDEAFRRYEEAIDMATDSGLRKEELENIYYFAHVLYETGMISESDRQMTRLIEKGESYGEEFSSMVAKGYYNRAVQRYAEGGPREQAIDDIKKAIAIAEQSPEENENDLADYHETLEKLECLSNKNSNSNIESLTLNERNEYGHAVDEMKGYLDGNHQEVLTCFSKGMAEFEKDHYDKAIYMLNLAQNKMSDDAEDSAKALVLRYLAFSKEILKRNGATLYSDEEISNEYDTAISLALNDENHTLIQNISHDMAEYQWAKGCYQEAEYYYWIEIYHLSVISKMHSKEYALALLNIGGALSREEGKLEQEMLLHIFLFGIFCAQVPDVVDEQLLNALYGQVNFIAEQLDITSQELSLEFGKDTFAIGKWMLGRSFNVHREEFDSMHSAALFAAPLLEFAMNYFNQVGDNDQLCESMFYRGYAALFQHDTGSAVKLFESLTVRMVEDKTSDNPELLMETLYGLANAYIELHDTDNLQALIENGNLDTSRIREMEYQYTPCACMLQDNQREEALSQLAEMVKRASDDDCTESEYYDLCLSSIMLSRKYEAKRYLNQWKNSWSYFGSSVEDNMMAVYNRLTQMIEDI